MTAPSEDIIAEVREQFGPKTLLAFSRGKDAIAAYVALRGSRLFDDIVPYHLYLVPGLEFVEESLAYYEGVFGRKIHNLPHPSFYKQLNRFLFQTPARASTIAAANLPEFSYVDVVNLVGKAEGVVDPMAASGVRAADSPMRRIALMTHGAISSRQRNYYPVWDWGIDRLVAAIKSSGIALPVDYELFGRSFDGIDLRFMLPLKKRRPADYRKVVEWFPLVELEIWRYERFGGRAA